MPRGSGCLMEVQRSRVHAVAFAGRGRAVIEDMAEMCPAAGTEHFIAHHPARGIGMGTDIECGYGSKKLGQPVPESNLVSDKKRSVPQQTQV